MAKDFKELSQKWREAYGKIYICSRVVGRLELKPQPRGWANSSFVKLLAMHALGPEFSHQNSSSRGVARYFQHD